MTLTLDQLPNPDSPLCRLDARWKLAALTLALLVVAALQTVPAASVALVGSVLLAGTSRLPLRWYLTRLGAVALFLLLFVILLPFLLREGKTWDLGPIHLPYGLAVALLLCLKALAVVTLTLVLLATTPLHVTLQAAHALRVPGLLVQLAMLTFRYIFVLSAELARLRIALQVRGYRNRANRHSYRTAGHVAGTLLVRGYERAERVGQAMRCRGFDGRFRSLTQFRTTAADVGGFLLVVGSAAALGLWDFVQR
jgi:cobalt/nickel transport system permease protein